MARTTNLDIDLLRSFVTVVECGGFSRAGQRLHRQQSTVSLQIRRLERSVGATLLRREPRHVVVTREGEIILDYARRMLALNDELIARVHEPTLAGVVRLGAPEDFATTHLPEILSAFTHAHPGVALDVTCELTLPLLERFRRGELDLVLVKREPQEPADGIRVWREPLVWAAAHRDVAERPGPLPLVVSPPPCVYRKRATDALDGAGRAWRIGYTCTSLAGTLAAVRAELGVTVLPKEMVPAALTILDRPEAGVPDLRHTEIALHMAPHIGQPVRRLSEYIVGALEHTTARGDAA